MPVQKEDFGGTAVGQRGWKTEIERWEEAMEVLMVDSKGWSYAQDGVRALKHHQIPLHAKIAISSLNVPMAGYIFRGSCHRVWRRRIKLQKITITNPAYAS